MKAVDGKWFGWLMLNFAQMRWQHVALHSEPCSGQWCATQTQVQICARVSLLLTELTALKKMQVAKGIQELIKEVRTNHVTIKLRQIPEIRHCQPSRRWQTKPIQIGLRVAQQVV